MRMTLLLLLLTGNPAAAETIHKWIDRSGKTHYGDLPAHERPLAEQRIDIDDEFDAEAYRQAVARQAELDRQVRQIEKREASRQRQVQQRLAEHDKYLAERDRQHREKEALERSRWGIEKDRQRKLRVQRQGKGDTRPGHLQRLPVTGKR